MDNTEKTYDKEVVDDSLIISTNEEKIFEGKEIEFNYGIVCWGDLEFDDCIIHIDGTSDDTGILVETYGRLTIKNCKVIGSNSEHAYFVRCNEQSTIRIKDTIFEECAYFLTGTPFRTLIKRCTFKNCSDGFFNTTVSLSNEMDITDSFMINDRSIDELECSEPERTADNRSILEKAGFDPYKEEDIKYFVETCRQLAEEQSNNNLDGCSGILKIDGDGKVCFNNVYFYQNTKINDIPGFGAFVCCHNLNIRYEKCTFEGLTFGLKGQFFRSCRFEKCSDWMEGDFDHCLFHDCTKMIRTGLGDIVKCCDFISCRDQLILMNNNSLIDNCFFKDIKNDDDFADSIIVEYPEEDSFKTEIRSCVFDGIEIMNKYLIATGNDAFRDNQGINRAYVDNCIFKNYNSGNGSLIKTDALCTSSNSQYDMIIIYDCEGIDYDIDDSLENRGKKLSLGAERTVDHETGSSLEREHSNDL